MSERVERHYRNVDYSEAPNAAPYTFRAVNRGRAQLIRQAKVATSQADSVIRAIDDAIDGANHSSPVPPNPEHHHHDVEELPMLLTVTEKLGIVAILSALESPEPPSDAQAA